MVPYGKNGDFIREVREIRVWCGRTLTQERVAHTCLLFTSRRRAHGRAAIGYVIVTRQSHKANTAKFQIILLSMAKINHGLVTQ